MKFNLWIGFALLGLALAVGCTLSAAPQETQTPADSTPGGLPDPQTTVVSVPDVEAAARAYLDAWADGDYLAMFNMLTTLSQDAISFEAFEARYRHVATEANVYQVEYEITSKLTNPSTSQVGYRVTLHSAIVGPITGETIMDLNLQDGAWRVVWGDHLILTDLVGGNTLSMERFTPNRGIIYDHDGLPIAYQTDAIALSVIPSQVELIAEEDEERVDGLIRQLATLTGLSPTYLSSLIFDEDYTGYLLPIAEVPLADWNARADFITPYGDMLSWQQYNTRLYYRGGAAPQAVGFVGPIGAEEVDDYVPRGYQVDDLVGRMGIESWGEEYLSGQRGGALYVISPEGNIVRNLAQSEAQPAYSIYTTLDRNLQLQAQQAIKDFTGAIVVLERDTGRVLAMVSSPGFNANDSDFYNNPNSQWSALVSDPRLPFINRATQGLYPPGSIFKIITLSAALESGLYPEDYTFFCGQVWDVLGFPLYDWTFEKELPASGTLDLLQGLMRSCNPLFYDIGLSLYNSENPTAVADLARQFGLANPTGIDIIDEVAGQVNDPAPDDSGATASFHAVQQAIGQSTTQITPLQAAVYVAAVGNGGTLYQPQLIERVEDFNGGVVQEFSPVVSGQLPISDETLQKVQTAMRMVVADPRGTAYRTFLGFQFDLAGKTGTAQDPPDDPHAWFIGYTFDGREDKPDIAVAVLVENIGDGSEFAAPIFRRVAETYFYGQPTARQYPWESQFGVLDPTYFLTEEELEQLEAQEGAEEQP